MASITVTVNPAYRDDDSEVLISKSTWPLKLSGLLFAGLLVVGRSVSYGNISWVPAQHDAASPLVVVHNDGPYAPAQPQQKPLPMSDPAALSKRMAADEVVIFSPGSNSHAAAGSDAADSNASAATTRAETTAAATTQAGEQTTEATQAETTVAAAPAPAPAPAAAVAPVRRLAQTGETPLAAEGALGAVLVLIGVALFKPRSLWRRFFR